MSAKRQTILLAEDEDSLQNLLVAWLSPYFTVVRANNGKTALGLFLRHRETLDMVISDIKMEEMDGLELVRAVRIENSGLPVLLISGGHSDPSRDRLQMLLQNPKTEFMKKPFSMALFITKVQQMLK